MNIQQIEPAHIVEDAEQPRKHYSEESLRGLADSIRQHGMLNPITVSPLHNVNRYRIVTGERRWRAATMIRLDTIPCIVKEIDAEERVTEQLIENLQREDLMPLEKSKAIQQIKTTLNLNNREISSRLGLSERSVGYLLELLTLPEEIGEAVISSPNRPADGQITEKHARFLKQLNETPELQTAVVGKIRETGLTSDETGSLVKALRKRPERAEEILASPVDHLADFFRDESAPWEDTGTDVAQPAPPPYATTQQILAILPSLSGISFQNMSQPELKQVQDALTSLKMAVEGLLKTCKNVLGEN